MLKTLGIDGLSENFSDLHTLKSPNDILETLLAGIGELFQCERVYVCKKNEENGYDCINEWVSEGTMPKKHLLQNLPHDGVRYYYHYFKRGQILTFDDIEAFRNQNEELYAILKPQRLQSMLCLQLRIDDRDLGFFGIDNPIPEKYAEMLNIAAVIGRYVSILVHQQTLESSIKDGELSRSAAKDASEGQPLPARILQIKEGSQAAVVYFEVTQRDHGVTRNQEILRHMLTHTERLLGSIFGALNVFRLEELGFIAILEGSENLDLPLLQERLTSVNLALDPFGIFAFSGLSAVRSYRNMADFFDMVYQANGKMLHQKKRYRDFYTEKYHFNGNSAAAFRELVEIHPERDSYMVLYHEYASAFETGSFSEQLQRMQRFVYPEDREKYTEFWQAQLALSRNSAELREGPQTHHLHFRMMIDNKTVWETLSVAMYIATNGEAVLLCYTQ
ncbi:MAG: hypothetical protein Q4B03_01470 [Lachnospiraceae bacterium]|nr:hypothetical protein [Lachnospiraceae bacterium]